jgi:hypothetical protein
MNDTIVDTMYAVLRKLVIAMEPGTRFGRNQAAVECTSVGKTGNEIPVRISAMARLMHIDTEDKLYSRIARCLFILYHEKKSWARYRITAKASVYAINEAEIAIEEL